MKHLLALILLCPLALVGMNEQPASPVQTNPLQVQIRADIYKRVNNTDEEDVNNSNTSLLYRTQRWVSNQPNAISRETNFATLNNQTDPIYNPIIENVTLNSNEQLLTITYYTKINNMPSATQVVSLGFNDLSMLDVNDNAYVELTTTLL